MTVLQTTFFRRKFADYFNNFSNQTTAAPTIDVFEMLAEEKSSPPPLKEEEGLSLHVLVITFLFSLCSILLFAVRMCLCHRKSGKVT